jgi:C1A family cysteine protease
MAQSAIPYGLGWIPDYPDCRDFTPQQKDIKPLLSQVSAADVSKAAALPDKTDLREWCSPVEDQGQLGSCTANAGVGMIEYFERRAFAKHIDGSRLFLYKATRNLLHWTGDTGALLRSTVGALALFGVPPEEYWPYDASSFDVEPPAFCYAFAQDYQAIDYYRLDPANIAKSELLARIKTNLAAGLPAMFGFTVYSCINQAATTGQIPIPLAGDKLVGGHAVMTVGYDDGRKIKHSNPAGQETTGALLIRNSWGPGWGEAGYGWLPYAYVEQELAVDWWSLIKAKWVDTGNFGQ